MTFVYLDLESTGLDPFTHEIYEIGYAVEDGDIQTIRLSHSEDGADPEALKMAGDRRLSNWASTFNELLFTEQMWKHLKGATVVGANPSFDTTFLRYAYRSAPWHYRLLDIEVYAMPMLGTDKPPGLHTICKRLQIENTAPHTAAGDIDAVRKVHKVLQAEYSSRLWLAV